MGVDTKKWCGKMREWPNIFFAKNDLKRKINEKKQNKKFGQKWVWPKKGHCQHFFGQKSFLSSIF